MMILAVSAGLSLDAPSVKPPSKEIRERFQLASFYEKHIDAWGVPIVSSAKVSDFALLEARHAVRVRTVQSTARGKKTSHAASKLASAGT